MFDERLARLQSHVYLLWVLEDALVARSLFRDERHGWAQSLIPATIIATIIDTSAGDWDAYARRIAETVIANG